MFDEHGRTMSRERRHDENFVLSDNINTIPAFAIIFIMCI